MLRYDVLIIREGRIQRTAKRLVRRPEAEAWADSFNRLNRGLCATAAVPFPHPEAAAISRARPALRSA
jgi:hypothetical protein